MIITFRSDSSIEIGVGHIMRCLTLADTFRDQGKKCQFICREHEGNIISHIEQQGFVVHRLPSYLESLVTYSSLVHAAWLGSTQEQDAAECIHVLKSHKTDWLIVDHYALDKSWESHLRPYTQKIMVIDDLADRMHDCDILLDQNLGHSEGDYLSTTSEHCLLLIGPEYALLRSEFVKWRGYSLIRREAGEIKNLLISLGGVDKDNYTSQVLHELRQAGLPTDIELTVVLGVSNPHINHVKQLAEYMPNPIQVLVGVHNMAEIMAGCDLAIGAAGATSWERCCLGLPSIILVLSDNQRSGAKALAQGNCAVVIERIEQLAPELIKLLSDKFSVNSLSQKSAELVDGLGKDKVMFRLMGEDDPYTLRFMQISDLDMVRSWRNHPSVRDYMFQQYEIGAEEHRQWFDRKNQDENDFLLIFEKDREPIGFLHLAIKSFDTVEWGFYLAPTMQGGLGNIFGQKAVEYCFHTLKAKFIHGEVLMDNVRSQRFHEKLGFIKEKDGQKRNSYYYVLDREQYMRRFI